ncbi:PcfJ domain-containing protein [Paenibacillus thiaminolyticus]|uniref:PcfJ domain-containing protein n=1 Tax=Paenibacillus thiaminolyticus TaxID=49283 RepID=UPI003D2C428C
MGFFTHFPTDISDEIRNYITDVVLSESRYLFTHREGSKQYAFCTHCKQEHRSSGLRHGKISQCPHCGTVAHVKASGRGRKNLIDNVYLLWYEKSVVDPAVIIARGFYVSRDYTKDYRKTETEIQPIALYLFEWGKGGQMARRCYWSRSSKWEIPKKVFSEARRSMSHTPSYYCIESIQKAVEGTPFQYCTWESYDYEDRVKVFDFAAKYPCMEYLTKLGMRPVVHAKLEGAPTYGAINWRGKTLEKVLRLTKSEAKEWVKQSFKNGLLSLRAYQKFKKLGFGLNFEQAHIVCNLAVGTEIKALERYATPEAIVKYVLKQANRRDTARYYHGAGSILRDWRDYLVECRELGMDLNNEGVLFPNNLHAAHQKTSAKIKFKRDEALDKQIRERAKKLKKFEFECNGLFLRPAASNKELFQEGKELEHCVGSYARRYASGGTNIFFVRKTEEPSKPFYTMEVSGGMVVQCRGYKNCSMTPEIREFVDQFISKKLLTSKQTRVDVTGIQVEQREGVAV